MILLIEFHLTKQNNNRPKDFVILFLSLVFIEWIRLHLKKEIEFYDH